MQYSTVAFGTPVVRHLQEHATSTVLTIGSDRYTRTDLAAVTCFNFIAAAHLNAAIKTLNVKSTRDLFKNVEPSALALPGIGTYAYVVLAAIFEHDGLGSIEDWLQRAVKKGEALVTVNSIKQRIQRETTKTVARPRKKKNGKA